MTRQNSKKPAGARRLSVSDFLYGTVGIGLCAGALFLPWHVYTHPDAYGPPEMRFSRGGVVPIDETTALASGNALFDLDTGKFVVADSAPTVDRLTTGRVDPNRRPDSDLDQPFPEGGEPFDVLAISRGRALIGDGSGIYLVSVNSRLPDGSYIRAIGRDQEGWHILTSSEAKLRVD